MKYSVEALYRAKGYDPKRIRDNELAGPCPFCQEGTDRFHIFTEQGKDGKGRYWCRQCGASGDSIQFLRDLDGLTYKEALAALGITATRSSQHTPCNRTASPAPRTAPVFEPAQAPTQSQVWADRAGAIVSRAQGQLAQNPRALAWLDKERGLTLETVRRAGLGWINQKDFLPYKAFGMATEYKENGKPKAVFIPRGLCIPVYHKGQLARVKFRLADRENNLPKYLPLKQPDNARNTCPLFIPCPNNNEFFVIVESELDGILLAQEAGKFINVLAMGSASNRPDLDTWTLLKQAKIVLVSLDYDEAGNKAACTWWANNLPKDVYRLWPVPEGKDQTDAYKAGYNLAEWLQMGIYKG